jgi:GNAT superfamily N-acetyltransferase
MTDTAISIRRCRADDLPAVFDLLIQLQEAAPTVEELSLETVRRLFGEMEGSPAFYANLVAIGEGRVCGFVSVICYKTLYHEGGTALINELVVDRSCRRAGVGRALIGAAREVAAERGMDELEVATEGFNRDAQAFYRRCGFDQEYVLFGMEFSEHAGNTGG